MPLLDFFLHLAFLAQAVKTLFIGAQLFFQCAHACFHIIGSLQRTDGINHTHTAFSHGKRGQHHNKSNNPFFHRVNS